MEIWDYKQAHTNLRIWGCRDASEGTWTWGYEDVRLRGYKQVHTNIRIWGYEDARIQASAQEPKDMSILGCEDISKSNISNMYVTSRLHVVYYNLLQTYTLYTLYV